MTAIIESMIKKAFVQIRTYILVTHIAIWPGEKVTQMTHTIQVM